MRSARFALAAALAAFGLAAPCHAQISGDVVRIGLVVDLTSLYADVTGQGVIEPFPTGNAKVNVATMEDGKVIHAAGDVPMPAVPKW